MSQRVGRTPGLHSQREVIGSQLALTEPISLQAQETQPSGLADVSFVKLGLQVSHLEGLEINKQLNPYIAATQ